MALKPFHVEDHVDNFYTQSYIAIRVHLVPNYHLAGDPLELPQVPLGVPGPHFENHCCRRSLYKESANAQCTILPL